MLVGERIVIAEGGMVEQDSESKADLLISQEDGECDEYMMCGSYCRLIYADAGHLLYT